MNSYAKKNIVIFWYIILFCFSAFHYHTITSYSIATAEESTVESRAVSDKVNNLLDRINADNKERSKLERAYIHHFIRKLAHIYVFFIYAFINMILFYLASNKNSIKSFIATLTVGVCGASLDEFLQLFVAGRAGLFSDVIVDMVGTCGGSMMLLIIIRFVKCCNKADFERVII